MLTASYICVSLSVVLLFVVIKIIMYKEKKRVQRYHGVIKKSKI